MKKSTKNTIALAAAVLLVSGTLATAAERADVSRTSASNTTRSTTTVGVAAGAVEDIVQDEPQGGGSREVCERAAEPFQSFLEPLICLVNPVNGSTFCWLDQPFIDDPDDPIKCKPRSN